jgi:hypothetical protein
MALVTPEEQLGQILALLGENSKGINELKSSMTEMRALKTNLLLWKPEVDHHVHELEHAVLDLGERVEQALSMIPQAQPLHRTRGEQFGEASIEPLGGVTVAQLPLTAAIQENHFASPDGKVPSSAHLELHPPRAASGSFDHGKGSSNQGDDFGTMYTTVPGMAPVTGATPSPNSPPALFHTDGLGHHDRRYYPPYPPYPPITPFPKVEFHKFDGSHPRLWIKQCETYFDVYQTEPSLWVKLASMRLVGFAGLWYQTMQSAISKMTWDAFVTTVCNRFDKDEHNHLLCHFFHIKQTPSIFEYTKQFGNIVHQLLAHDPSFPPSVITNRFIDGLKKEIRAVVMMHCPQDLDTASSLAFLQEEACQDQPVKRSKFGSYSKKNTQDSVKPPYITAP